MVENYSIKKKYVVFFIWDLIEVVQYEFRSNEFPAFR